MKNSSFQCSVILLLVAFFCAPLLIPPQTASAQENSDQQALVDKARITFESFMSDQKMTWLQENFSDAKGLIIIPSQIKGGFIIGGSGGSGVLVVKDSETGEWSQPGFYTIGSVSFGLQIGGEAAEIIMMVRTESALNRLYSTSVKLGGDTSVAVGPVGAGAKSGVTAGIVSFARSKGAYAGVSLEGSVLKIRDDWNEAYYGQPVQPVDIFVKQEVSNPGADELIQALSEAEVAGK